MNDIFRNLIQKFLSQTNSASVDVFSALKKLQQLQEERIHAYHLFNEAHKIYLGTAPQYDFARFRGLVQQVTQDFKRIAKDIDALQSDLQGVRDGAFLAGHIAAVQEAEKQRLELTARLQLAKQSVVDHPDETEREIKVLELKHRLRQVIYRISGHLEDLKRAAFNQ